MVYGRACMTGKRALCLGGAKNHLIVVPDADLEVAAGHIVASFTGCAGQRCMAAANLLAVGDVEHRVIWKLQNVGWVAAHSVWVPPKHSVNSCGHSVGSTAHSVTTGVAQVV